MHLHKNESCDVVTDIALSHQRLVHPGNVSDVTMGSDSLDQGQLLGSVMEQVVSWIRHDINGTHQTK